MCTLAFRKPQHKPEHCGVLLLGTCKILSTCFSQDCLEQLMAVACTFSGNGDSGQVYFLPSRNFNEPSGYVATLIALFFLVLPLAGCSGPVVKNPTPVGSKWTQVEYPDAEYRLQVGDELDIKFFYNPELNEKVVVRPDGRISLQLINEVKAAGMTPEELTKELEKQYEAELATPEVTVIVRSFSAFKVYVDGEVMRPGIVALNTPMSVFQSIAFAGGVKETARTNEVVIIRRGTENKLAAIPINLDTVIDGTDMRQDIALVPYDIVYVPKSPIANAAKWVDMYLRKTIMVLPEEFILYYSIATR